MEERNFRSYYYEKVGFRVVEEKKSLEILLKEKPVDRVKLIQFALRFPVPAIHRILLWKLLLDILPLHLDQHEFVLQQRVEQFEDLQDAVRLLVRLPEKQSSKFNLFVLMKHLESGKLKLDYTSQLCSQDSHIFITINEALSDIVDCDCDNFWITKGIFELLKKNRPHYPALVSYADKLLLMQDEQLYTYLASQKILCTLPLEEWFDNCFAEILPIIPLQRILDKVLGGSSIIMVFVVISLLCRTRQTIFKLNNSHKLVDSLKKTMCDHVIADVVVTDAIEHWQNCGKVMEVRDHHKILRP